MEPDTALLDPPGSRLRSGELGQQLATPVGALILRQALFVSPEDTVAEAARVMRQAKVSSALVSGDPLGILTSGDLRNRVLAEELPAGTPVSAVMTGQVRCLPEDAPLYTALLLMLDHGFEHIPITRDGAVIGVVTHMDMLRHQAHSPMLLLGRIRSIDRLEALDGYAEEIAATAQALLADGVKAARIAHVIASLNDALSGRLLQLAHARLGPPPCPYAWLALGSEGRMEQVLLSDQDSALVYRDDTPAAAEYFASLAGIVVDGLLRAGFAPCPGGYMATTWCRSLPEWELLFRTWVERPEPQALVEAAIFLDFRAVHGTLSVQPLADILLASRHAPLFLAALAGTASSFAPPLGMFGRIRTEDRYIDLKRGALAAIVILARIFALESGSPARGTLPRLEAAAKRGVVSAHGAEELSDTFQFLLRLRLREQLRQLALGHAPDNRICYDDLTWLEQRRLRDAFRTVAEMQKITTVRLRGQ